MGSFIYIHITPKQPIGAIQFPIQLVFPFFPLIDLAPLNQMSRFQQLLEVKFVSDVFFFFQTYLTGVPARGFAWAAHAIAPGSETVCLQRMRPPVHCQEQLATSRVGAYGHQVWKDGYMRRLSQWRECRVFALTWRHDAVCRIHANWLTYVSRHRNYECEHCHKKFSRSYYLTDHLKVMRNILNIIWAKMKLFNTGAHWWKALHLRHLWKDGGHSKQLQLPSSDPYH